MCQVLESKLCTFSPLILVLASFWTLNPFSKPALLCSVCQEAEPYKLYLPGSLTYWLPFQPMGDASRQWEGRIRETPGNIFLVPSLLPAASPALAVPLHTIVLSLPPPPHLPLPPSSSQWLRAYYSSLCPFSLKNDNGFLLLLVSECLNNIFCSLILAPTSVSNLFIWKIWVKSIFCQDLTNVILKTS